ncbi:MAG TPA: sterol desaturase, partial [Chitinophagaceae bacterium]
NPIKINFQHIWLLIKDAWRTNSWKDKFTLWFKPTGYRPADVAEKYPVEKIQDVYHFEKYDTRTSPAFNAWSWLQLLVVLFSISYLFGNIAYINSIDHSYIYWYGAFIFLSVYALTDLMDRNRSAMISEILRSGLGLYFLYQQDDWFGASQWLPSVKYMLGAYFVLSLAITAFFVIKHKREDVMQAAL